MNTILIVDDNINNIDVLIGFLRTQGHRILVATNGEKALKTAQHTVPDIILLDVMMPGIDGFEVCRRLKADPLTQSVPVLFLSARNEPEALLQGFEVGGADYILKPFYQEEVLARLNVHLHNRMLLLELDQARQQLEQKVIERTVELQRLNQQLLQEKNIAEQATKTKDKFVSLVAHDLRAPLQGMKGYVQCLMEDLEQMPAVELRQFFQKIAACVDHQSAMINGILNVSRFHTGQITLNARFIDAYFLAAAAVDKILFLAEQKGIVIENRVPKGQRIYVDDYLFGEVLANLLSNAIKFSRRGGTICLTWQVHATEVVLAVTDRGVGIPPAFLPDLFRLEVKTSMTGTAGETGSGLGLPYSQDIMRLHGGEIRVETALQQGSTFYLHLPVIIPKVLLILADEQQSADWQMVLSQYFQAENTRVSHVPLAQAQLTQALYHLILIEHYPPALDGLALLRWLKNTPLTKMIPVIFIAAGTERGIQQQCFDGGCDDYLGRPFTDSERITHLRRFIGPIPATIAPVVA